MNKTIIININGTVFHIEEQAYELLKTYMTGVKRHFVNSADSLEITTDIENRIAEMFTEILARESRQALVEQDVIDITQQMGSVEDFEPADESAGSNFTSNEFHNNHGASRRLFRNPDDHLISGVCAGIANYFDVPALWIRIAFVISFAFFGTGIFLYIILWVIVPKAATRADRMAMKGEPLDLQGFKRNFEAEMHQVSGHLADLQQEARPLIYKTRDFIGDFLEHLGKFLGSTGKLLIKLLAVGIMLAFAAGIVFLVAIVGYTLVSGNTRYFNLPADFFSYQYINQVYIAALLLAVIPLASLIILIARLAFNTVSLSRSTGYTLLVVWISALVVLIYHGSIVASEFQESAGFTKTINLKPTASQVYQLELNEEMFFTPEDSARLDIKNKFQNLTLTYDDQENMEPRSVIINVEKGDVPYPVITESFTARGRSYEDALMNARNTQYVFTQKDSVLKFDYKLRRLKNTPWHNEDVRITLKLPLNATVMVGNKINRYIGNYLDLDCSDEAHRRSNDDQPAAFIMTNNGLECKYPKIEEVAEPEEIEQTTADSIVTDTITTVVDTVYKRIVKPKVPQRPAPPRRNR